MTTLAVTPAICPRAPSAVPLSWSAVELDGQGVLEVAAGPAPVPPPRAPWRWRGVRCATRGRRPRVRRRWGGLGRRLGPCPLPLPALAAIEGARVLGPGAWRQVVDVALQGLRKDYAETLGAIVTALIADAETGSTAAPTWAALAAAAGCVERTVGRWIAWLRARRLLVTVEHGSTEATRPRSMALEGNRAAVYLLTEPVPEPAQAPAEAGGPVSDAGPTSVTDVGVIPPAFALRRREKEPPRGRASSHGRGEQRCASPSPPWGAAGKNAEDEEGRHQQHQGRYQRAAAGTKGEQRTADLAIAAALRRSALDLRAISDAAVRSIIRPLTAAGWDLGDLIHAIEHDIDGTRRWYTSAPALPIPNLDVDKVTSRRRQERPAAPVASPAAWLRWRLSPWQGHPGPATARRAATVAAQRAEAARAAQRRQAAAAAAAAAIAAPPVFAAARAALRAAARPSAAERSLQPWMPGDLAARRQAGEQA